MTEITQADRDAAAEYDVVEAFARHRKYGYDQGYYDGRQFDRMEERAAIVAWLRRHKAGIAPIRIVETSTISKSQSVLADAIEAGEHWK